MRDDAVPLSRVTIVHIVVVDFLADGHVGDGFGLGLLASFGGEVGFVEELCEEDEVREVHGHGELDVDLADVAAGGRGGGGHIVVRPHVDGAAHDHLRQLQHRDRHRQHLRRVLAHAHQRVVRVHYTMDAVVHHDEPTSRGRVFREGIPGVQQDGDVVVPVQED